MKSAVILAGGRSLRMGLNKCALQFFEKPLIYWPYDVLRSIADEVIVSISTEEDIIGLEDFLDEVIVVRDEKPRYGPISGLFSCFKAAKGEYIAVSPCDSPFIKKELYFELFKRAQNSEGAVCEVNGYWEPLHAVYKKDAMINAIKTVLEEGKKSPQETYRYLNIQKIREEEIKKFDPQLHSFFNINSRQDLEKAVDIFEKTQRT
jgi:molybdopterin-guanine dinucleotide biosynthesis protein A